MTCKKCGNPVVYYDGLCTNCYIYASRAQAKQQQGQQVPIGHITCAMCGLAPKAINCHVTGCIHKSIATAPRLCNLCGSDPSTLVACHASNCPCFGTIGITAKSLNPTGASAGIVSKATAGSDIWEPVDFKHKKAVNANKLDTLYVEYKSNGNWAVIGTIGDRDILIKTCACERDANDWMDALLKKLS